MGKIRINIIKKKNISPSNCMLQKKFQAWCIIFALETVKTGSCYKTGYFKASSILSQYSFIKILLLEKQVL